MHPNFEYLKSYFNISEESFYLLQQISSKKILKANTKIAEVGKKPNKIYQLNSGIARSFIVTESGKEWNKNLYFPTDFIGPLTAITSNKPSLLTYETLTKCEVYEVDFVKFLEYTRKHIDISNLYNKILEKVYINYEKRQLELITLNATERYRNLQKNIPNIDSIIPQFQIASYLNITPVQLSRIKKQI
ncbi:hypothetical protein GCM10022271_07470 [Corallibacter vietnamensis]|uniref:Cyclic nucleotide-binding domain-containing protein n=1 Tax=Corallibacter vietnamensis TaxID=904130 RepID=A0ABP7H227_9FLAO